MGRITEHLGSGQFGTVNKGVWQGVGGGTEVAVKMLQEGTSEQDTVRFLQEAAINGQFRHPNIVQLLGVVTVGKPVCKPYPNTVVRGSDYGALLPLWSFSLHVACSQQLFCAV